MGGHEEHMVSDGSLDHATQIVQKLSVYVSYDKKSSNRDSCSRTKH